MGRLKKRKRAGETIAETLVAILIIALCFVMLCGAVTTAANINSEAKKKDREFSASEGDTTSPLTVQVNGHSVDGVTLHENNGYYYYEKNS